MEQIIAAIMALIASLTGGNLPAGLSSLPQIPGIQAPAPQQPGQNAISAQRAFEIAYGHAGINGASTYDHDAELERENGRLVWDIDFETRTYEYEYHIDAYTGAVVRSHREWND